MDHSAARRKLLLVAAALPFSMAFPSRAFEKHDALSAKTQFENLEAELGGRLGVFAVDTASGAELAYRAHERFPFCSTFKAMTAAAILDQSVQVPELLQQRLNYQQSDLIKHSPVTEKHVVGGMTVAELCAAAIQYSDNTAANLLIRTLGGPEAVTAFARSIGDTEFRLDRWEPELNTAIPNDPRDTTTPAAMGRSLQRLVLSDALASPHREQLRDWMRGNTTGDARIKAGIPGDWLIGDKTGSGAYGTANDIAVLWRPQSAPVVLAVYTTQQEKEAKPRNDIIAFAAQIVVGWLG